MESHWVDLDRFAPSWAREVMRDELTADLTPERLEDAQLAVSEIASAFVRTGVGVPRAGLIIEVRRTDATVRVSIRSSPGFPLPGRMLDLTGVDYGLKLAHAVSDGLEIEVDPFRVWFELGRGSSSGGRDGMA